MVRSFLAHVIAIALVALGALARATESSGDQLAHARQVASMRLDAREVAQRSAVIEGAAAETERRFRHVLQLGPANLDTAELVQQRDLHELLHGSTLRRAVTRSRTGT
jgi:hypothetical protein